MQLFLFWMTATIVFSVEARDPRNAQELTRCIRIAEPLIHEPEYVFPLSSTEINNVCGMWEEFVECVQQYTATFLTRRQQEEFDDIIQPSMRSIHQLCVQDEKYQQAYLYYAPCMKAVSIEEKFCGSHYNLLARLAESTADTVPAICCGYHKFRSCVLREVRNECDRERNPAVVPPGGDSTQFVYSMLNRALGFLLQMCKPNQSESDDCLATLSGNSNPPTSNVISKNNGIGTIFNDDRLTTSGIPKDTYYNVNSNKNNDFNSRNPSSNWSPSHYPINRGTSPSSRRPSPVTVFPPVTPHNNNHFTWTTTSPSSFFPTRNSSLAGFLSNEIREPERFRGSCVKSTPSMALAFIISTLPLIASRHFL